eukprot:GGOE01007101.1.p1 GENE.GGOE01007101.1~~GGOE01007101.1.p1  ORF type:complete len:600 (+),score=130.27 GGOE01007101.1:265-1800(+)
MAPVSAALDAIALPRPPAATSPHDSDSPPHSTPHHVPPPWTPFPTSCGLKRPGARCRMVKTGWWPATCALCDVSLLNPCDWDAHLMSKDHGKRWREREQRAILVHGLPAGTTLREVHSIFQSHRLAPDAVQYVPTPESGGHWHILLNTVDEARAIVKLSPTAFGLGSIIITLAMPPDHCAVCNVTVTSAFQLQQHMEGNRHREALRKRAGGCGLLLSGVPLAVCEGDVLAALVGCEVLRGGLLLSCNPNEPFQTAHVALASPSDMNRAFAMLHANPSALGAAVQVTRSPGEEDDGAAAVYIPMEPQVTPISGLKTAREVHLLVCSLLSEHNVEDVQAISPTLFSRICTIFMSCKPSLLNGTRPRDRFFAQFEAQAGSRSGLLPLQQALDILQPLEADWPFPLPAGVQEWLRWKMSKFCPSPEVDLLSKGRFAQVRNLISDAFHATNIVMEKIAANCRSPPAMRPPPRRLAHSMATHSSAPSSSCGSDEFMTEVDVDNQPWDDISLDVEWAM